MFFKSMRLAVISDIHGNLAAFEAVLEDITQQRVDQVVINGDIINTGPDSLACLELAYNTGFALVAGNHERYIRDFDAPDRPEEWQSDLWRPSLWTAQQLGVERRAALHKLAWSYEREDVLIVHASVRHDQDSLFGWTHEDELAAMFPGDLPSLIIRSHNHIPQFRPWGQRLIVSSGAVGQSLDGSPWAKYVIAEQRNNKWLVEHRTVAYDIEATVQRFQQSGYLEWAAPMSRLYLREVMFGTHHIVPFVRMWSLWREHEPTLSIDQAVERFLAI